MSTALIKVPSNNVLQMCIRDSLRTWHNFAQLFCKFNLKFRLKRTAGKFTDLLHHCFIDSGFIIAKRNRP